MPARLGEVKNVKDFGATGDGFTDDRSYIQDAIDYTTSPYSSTYRGIIYFPPGVYHIGSALTFDDPIRSIVFQGCGNASAISGSFNDFLLKRAGSATNQLTSGIRAVKNLFFQQGHATGGCLKFSGSIEGVVEGCDFSGNRGVDMSYTQGSTVNTCNFSSGGNQYGSYAIFIGENGGIISPDITGFQYGIACSGAGGLVIQGARFERNGTAISSGRDMESGSPSSMGSLTVLGATYESNGICIDFYGGTGAALITGGKAIGFESVPPYEYGTVVTSQTITGVSSGAIRTGSISTDGILTLGAGSGTFTAGERITGSGVPTGTFIYAFTSGSGGSGSTAPLTGSPKYGIRIIGDSLQNSQISGMVVGGQCYVSNIYMTDPAANRSGIVFSGVSCSNASTLGGTTWTLPTKANMAQWINCDVQPTFLFSGLPSGGTSANQRIGDSFYITDGNQATVGGNVTAGSGSNKSLVTWNGSNWIRGT